MSLAAVSHFKPDVFGKGAAASAILGWTPAWTEPSRTTG
jgi:hypothetical protein